MNKHAKIEELLEEVFSVRSAPRLYGQSRLVIRREDGSVVYNCCWPSLAQSFSGPTPSGLVTFYCLTFETPPTWRARSPYLNPQEQGVSVILYDRRFTANQFVLATSHLIPTTCNFIFQLNTCGYGPYVTSSLEGWMGLSFTIAAGPR
jgi:hypothetical protein